MILAYSVSIALMISLPLILAVLLRRRVRVPWLLFCVGTLTFAASQAVHLPLNKLLADWGLLPKAGQGVNAPLWQTALLIGLSAGLCEELARGVGYAVLRRYRTLEDGVMLGLGHGGLEAMVFGGVQLATAVSTLLPLSESDLTALTLSPEQLVLLERQVALLLSSPWLAFVPLLERLLAMVFHVILSLLVLQAFRLQGARKNWFHRAGFLTLAILYHAAVNAGAGAIVLKQKVVNLWLIEGLFALALVPGAVWAFLAFKKESLLSSVATPVSQEWSVFLIALRKELFQLWRTHRVLAVAGVFGVFGMTSPLLAYFTPQILSLIPGAEQFAALVPEPTISDAYAQYIKNLTQFGFLLVILVGMSAVAGEKERGTAALILSKPMSRWAFILSKWTAQTLVYLGGFLLAMLGAGFYIAFLFGKLDIAVLASVTVLLFFWLLPFISVTLLGSVIGSTTSAAAGVALAVSIALLVLGSLPVVKSFLPGALVDWAGLIGAGAPPQAWNGGALTACLVLCLISILFAIAVFERQEV